MNAFTDIIDAEIQDTIEADPAEVRNLFAESPAERPGGPPPAPDGNGRRPPRQSLFVQISDADVGTIVGRLDAATGSTALLVWIDLNRRAREDASPTVKASINQIRYTSGLSRRSVIRCTALLETLGMIEVSRQTGTTVEGNPLHETNAITLLSGCYTTLANPSAKKAPPSATLSENSPANWHPLKEKSIREEREDKNTPQPPKGGNSRFVPPTVDEVKAYCRERGNTIDPQQFVNHYQSNGWHVGKPKMHDWQAAVRTWEGYNYSQPRNRNTTAVAGNPSKYE